MCPSPVFGQQRRPSASLLSSKIHRLDPEGRAIADLNPHFPILALKQQVDDFGGHDFRLHHVKLWRTKIIGNDCRVDHARANHVDANIGVPVGFSHAAPESDHSVLGQGIERVYADRGEASDGRA